MGFEPTTFWLATKRSTPELYSRFNFPLLENFGAAYGNRTRLNSLEGCSITTMLMPLIIGCGDPNRTDVRVAYETPGEPTLTPL